MPEAIEKYKVKDLKKILEQFDDNADIVMCVNVEDGTVSGLGDRGFQINVITAHLDVNNHEFLNDSGRDRLIFHSGQTFDAAYEKETNYLLAKARNQIS